MDNIKIKKKVGRPKGTKNKPGVKTGRPKKDGLSKNISLSMRISEKEKNILNEIIELEEFKGLSQREILFKILSNYLLRVKTN